MVLDDCESMRGDWSATLLGVDVGLACDDVLFPKAMGPSCIDIKMRSIKDLLQAHLT